jgi:tetratricopeptide (TPR) repeat protein
VPDSQLAVYSDALYKQAKASFRQGDFQAAANLFEKADRAGFKDPIVFYNLGVAQFRLGHFDDAEASFATAAAFDNLAPLAYYNLGLIARRQDDYRDAYGWFRQSVLHPESSAKLRRLSKQAMASLPKVQRKKPTLHAMQETQLSDFLRFSFNAGYGQDSNVYRAPKNSYVDLGQQGSPTIVPLVQSGSFVPLDADVEFRWAPYERGHFSIRYDFDGKVFTKAEQQNANAFRNRFSIGGRVFIPKKNGYRYFRSHFVITRYDENYYDRTDGQDMFFGTTNISDRFRRTRFGPQIYYHRERGRFGYGMTAEAFINKYDNDFEEPVAQIDLTHEQYRLGAHVSFDVLRATALRLSYNRTRRDYTQRTAKSANGIRFTTNDNLQYDYQDARVKISQDLSRRLGVSLAYQYTIRTDNFEGYDDYNRHSGLAELAFRGRRFSAQTGIVYRTYDFPNGFAFDLPSAGEKSLDRMYAYFEASVQVRPRYAIMLSAEMDVVESTDPRTAYDRNQISLGMRWSL